MAEVVVRQSDLSGELITAPEERAELVVSGYPEVPGSPRSIDAHLDEIKDLGQLSLEVVTVEVLQAGQEEPTVHVLRVEDFNGLFGEEADVGEILTKAKAVRARRVGNAATSNTVEGPKRDYTSMEWAGAPHKGKTTEQEKQLVRARLDEVNERLAEQGLRQIELSNKDHVERYGLHELARERGITPE